MPKPIGFSVRCDDFNITYYDLKGPEKHIKEYSSLITILENGKQVLQKTVIVNHPLHYKGLSFYQSSYGAFHDITLGIQYNDKKEKEIVKAFEGEIVPIPNSEDLDPHSEICSSSAQFWRRGSSGPFQTQPRASGLLVIERLSEIRSTEG